MNYYFRYGLHSGREMVCVLDEDELKAMWSDEYADRNVYRDLSVTFDVDRYIRLHDILKTLEQQDRNFGKLEMSAVVDSESASDTHKIRDDPIGIYWKGIWEMAVKWWDDWSQSDFGIDLIFPPDFYADPAAWIEHEIAAKGIKSNITVDKKGDGNE